MEEPPEIFSDTATPAQILVRLDFIRLRYRMGQLDAPAFNEVLKIFQFRDASDALWTPGAQSNTWYRWDGRRWVVGNPPAHLRIPPMPLGIQTDGHLPRQEPAESPAVVCPRCGAENIGKKFCTKCGTKLT